MSELTLNFCGVVAIWSLGEYYMFHRIGIMFW